MYSSLVINFNNFVFNLQSFFFFCGLDRLKHFKFFFFYFFNWKMWQCFFNGVTYNLQLFLVHVNFSYTFTHTPQSISVVFFFFCYSSYCNFKEHHPPWRLHMAKYNYIKNTRKKKYIKFSGNFRYHHRFLLELTFLNFYRWQ